MPTCCWSCWYDPPSPSPSRAAAGLPGVPEALASPELLSLGPVGAMRLGCSFSLLVWLTAFVLDGWRGIGMVAVASVAGVIFLVLRDREQAARDRETAWRRWAEWDVEDQRPWRGPR
jgi:hypothetical protein